MRRWGRRARLQGARHGDLPPTDATLAACPSVGAILGAGDLQRTAVERQQRLNAHRSHQKRERLALFFSAFQRVLNCKRPFGER